jgi:Aspartyl/Asparaginyl beta-hydroxylase
MSQSIREPGMVGLQLPLAFDAEGLHGDLRALPPEAWRPHYNEADYGGVWRGVALRSPSGDAGELFAGAAAYRDTPLLDLCPGIRQVLAAFECKLKSVRLLSLAPGSFIREHTDDALDFEDGEVRIHIPVQTNADVEFYVAGERMLLAEGGAYYVNVNLPHRVNNRGACERIHLVIDAEVDDWVRDLFHRGAAIPRSADPPRGVAGFRERLFRDDPWQEQLREIGDARDFEQAAVRLGGEVGFELNEGDVGAVLRGAAGVAPPDWRPPRDWTAVRFFVRRDEPWAEWVHTGERRFTESFFEDTVGACLRVPFARFSRAEAPLEEDASAPDPCGFVFHTSRCGSTLAAQMFAALPRFSVFSEPALVDQAIQAGNPEWLRRTVRALGRGRAPFLVKLDAWHIHALPLVRAAFPSVPWVFLFRDPAAVLRSHLRAPGRHCVRGLVDPAMLRVDPAECEEWDLAGWAARVTAAICRSAVSFRGEAGGLYLDHGELPEAVIRRMAPHLGIPLTETDIERMRVQAGFDSKSRGMPFSPPASPPRDERVSRLVREFGLDQLYRELRLPEAREYSC